MIGNIFELEQKLKDVPYLPGDPKNQQLWAMLLRQHQPAIVAGVLNEKQKAYQAAQAEAAEKNAGGQQTVVENLLQKMAAPPLLPPSVPQPPTAAPSAPSPMGQGVASFGPMGQQPQAPRSYAGGGVVTFADGGDTRKLGYPYSREEIESGDTPAGRAAAIGREFGEAMRKRMVDWWNMPSIGQRIAGAVSDNYGPNALLDMRTGSIMQGASNGPRGQATPGRWTEMEGVGSVPQQEPPALPPELMAALSGKGGGGASFKPGGEEVEAAKRYLAGLDNKSMEQRIADMRAGLTPRMTEEDIARLAAKFNIPLPESIGKRLDERQAELEEGKKFNRSSVLLDIAGRMMQGRQTGGGPLSDILMSAGPGVVSAGATIPGMLKGEREEAGKITDARNALDMKSYENQREQGKFIAEGVMKTYGEERKLDAELAKAAAQIDSHERTTKAHGLWTVANIIEDSKAKAAQIAAHSAKIAQAKGDRIIAAMTTRAGNIQTNLTALQKVLETHMSQQNMVGDKGPARVEWAQQKDRILDSISKYTNELDEMNRMLSGVYSVKTGVPQARGGVASLPNAMAGARGVYAP